MTLVDIKNALLSHFLSYPTFNVEEDINLFKLDPKEVGSDFSNNLKDIVTYGLQELDKLGIVARVKEGLYVLIQPLNQLNQTVILSPITALMIADIVNNWTEQTGEQKDPGYVVTKLAVTDRDVQALCTICHTLMSINDEPEGESEDREEEGEKKK